MHAGLLLKQGHHREESLQQQKRVPIRRAGERPKKVPSSRAAACPHCPPPRGTIMSSWINSFKATLQRVHLACSRIMPVRGGTNEMQGPFRRLRWSD
jgi:hypothetical protein